MNSIKSTVINLGAIIVVTCTMHSLQALQDADVVNFIDVDLKSGDLQRARQSVQSLTDVNSTDFDGNTALHYAARSKAYDLMQDLINRGADVNKPNKDGSTPLFALDPDVVKYLIDHGANVNAAQNDGWTKLHYAIVVRNLPVVKMLISAGASLHKKNKAGDTPLNFAQNNVTQGKPGAQEMLDYLNDLEKQHSLLHQAQQKEQFTDIGIGFQE